MGNRLKIAAGAFFACAVGFPIGYAIAGDPGEEGVAPISASECSADANDAWADPGLPHDSYSGDRCPSVVVAEDSTAEISEIRRRGLSMIAANIRAHGNLEDPEVRTELAEIEDELSDLGGALPVD